MSTSESALDLRGIIPATVLPMTQDARIDEPELRKYIRWVAGQGIRAVAVNVDTGEGPHLWHEERLRVLRVYKEELAGRGIPIVAGLGASFTAQAVKYAGEYREAGADCLLVFPITAYLGTPLSPEVPYRYHKAIADETGLPLILFTLQPALGGTDFTDETLLRLIEIPQVVAIKEALFDAKRFREIVDVVRGASRRITVRRHAVLLHELGMEGKHDRGLHFASVPHSPGTGLADLGKSIGRDRPVRHVDDSQIGALEADFLDGHVEKRLIPSVPVE